MDPVATSANIFAHELCADTDHIDEVSGNILIVACQALQPRFFNDAYRNRA